ncbi:hypothetical protein P3X46_023868 [Hevea brasiliensis]|uniref:Mur ligase central domain-containing protein n=1 Tax=Hevea brasiliensis TaxID=3981 RepID=A0ABQ9LCE2_HEVBR|nr:hypothetical protein P3X46_023868 [Hevea brasiliensis]
MRFLHLLSESQWPAFPRRKAFYADGGGSLSLRRLEFKQLFFSYRKETELKDFIDYLDSLKNHEKSGVPKDAGTDSDEGFDLGRMRRLMDRLGNPHSKFKVFTAIAFSLFVQENVDIAVIEAGLGGDRDATNIICSSGLALSVITSIGEEHLMALGVSLESIAMAKAGIIKHGRWGISDGSIRVGLENTCLLGRSQFLASKEAEVLGLPGATILLDGTHTKESAKALVDTIKMTFPEARMALVVAMACDKDHMDFAREFLLDKKLEAVFLTEVDIAGGKSRTTTASLLRDYRVQASEELGINALHDGVAERQELLKNRFIYPARELEGFLLRVANEFLKGRTKNRSHVLVVTGCLHIVSSVLARLCGYNVLQLLFFPLLPHPNSS